MEILNQIILSNLQQLEIPFFLSSLSSEIYHHVESETGVPGDSDGKESPCSAGDLGSFPGSGRYPGGKDMATHSSVFAWRIPMDRGAWRATVHGVAKRHK